MARNPEPIKYRKSAIREPKPKILIVCEGQKTEPDYLNELKIKYRLASVVVVHHSEYGSAPISVVKFANYKNAEQIELYGDSAKFEEVFCVYDTDEHSSLPEALQQIKKSNFKVIISTPCFEYWLLLHYEYTRSPILKANNKSTAEICANKLKNYIPQYDKSKIKEYFSDLFAKLETATKNSKKSYIDAKDTGEVNPSTNMHELIKILNKYKR